MSLYDQDNLMTLDASHAHHKSKLANIVLYWEVVVFTRLLPWVYV